jgi:integrase
MIAVNRARVFSRQSRRFILTKVGECLYRSDCGSYFAVVKHQGKQHRHCLQTKDRDVARKKLAEFRQQLQQKAPAADPAAPTFEQLAWQWLEATRVFLKPSSAERRRWLINALVPYFPLTARNITKVDVEQWASIRSKRVKAATFNKEADGLRQIFQFAIEHGVMLENPAVGLRRRRIVVGEKLTPTGQQFRAIVRELRGNQVRDTSASADLVELLGYSGARLGEALAVRWRDIQWKRGTLTLTGGEHGTKNYQRRIIPLFKPLERLLREMAARTKEARFDDKIIRIHSAKVALANACQRLGLPSFQHHAFRHFFASNAVEQGIDFRTIAGWLGHRDGGALLARTYSHLRAEHSAEMAKRMVFDAS